MSGKADPLAAALDAVTGGNSGGAVGKVVALFGDRPQVLESIRRARFERKLSYSQIADTLTAGLPGDESICDGAVKNWLNKQKPDG